jgi:tetratricopeptide (TPR) repeat protein
MGQLSASITAAAKLSHKGTSVVWNWLDGVSIRDWTERRRAFKELDKFKKESLYLASDESNPLNLAKLSVGVGDHTEAARRWEEAVALHLPLVRKSRDSLNILLELKRFDEAEALMASCKREYPGDPHYAQGYALVAQRRGDSAEALKRWQEVRKRFPGSWTSHVEETVCLGLAGRQDEADTLISRSIHKFPESLHVWIQWARVADNREDWHTSAERWQVVSSKFGWAGATTGLSRALERLGKPDEAFDILTAAESKFSRDPGFRAAMDRAKQMRSVEL